jgi:DNA-directed RNA polymerase specialized sigma24 family protein
MRSTVSTRQSPAGGPRGTSHSDALLRELRRGERDAFVRYFELFRVPVYGFARQLLDDDAAAVAATTETFAVVLRRAVLDEGATDLQTLTFRSALDACAARAGAVGVPRRPTTETSRPFEAALESLDLRRRAALLLHDVHGLDAAGIAAVFAITEEAAGAELFRAREEFRAAFDAGSARPEGRGCRQAEQAVAGAVGMGIAGDQLQRLRLHAAYCRPCRRAMRTWGAAPVGLAAVLEPAPLPQALAEPPVFGGAIAAAPVPSPRAGLLATLRPAAHFLGSRTVAYLVAVACLALAAGVAINAQGVRPSLLFQSVGPAVRLVTGTSGEAQPGPRRVDREAALPSPSVVTRASFVTAGSQPQAAETAVAPAPDAATSAAPVEGGSDVAPRDVASGEPRSVAVGSAGAKAGTGRSGKDKAGGRSGKAESDRGRSVAVRAKPDRASASPRRASASRVSAAEATRKATTAKSTKGADKKPREAKKSGEAKKPRKPAKPKKGG